MAKTQVTIHDIARKLGISASTVSRALRQHPRISKKTRELVLQTAEKMNYQPNLVASGLRTGKLRNIGLIVPKINRFFFADTISGIESVTNPAGYNLIICQSNESYQKEIENIHTLLSSRVDGIIISISSETRHSEHLNNIIEQGIPLVQFDRVRSDVNSCKVLNDNFQAAYDTTLHLLGQGYDNIAHLAGPLSLEIYRERFEGYKKALSDRGITFDKKLFAEGELTYEFGVQAATGLLKKYRPGAIFSAGDYAALGALNAVLSAGIEVPGEMGIAGFANEQITRFCTPALTSVDQYAYTLGSTSAELLLEQLGLEKSARMQKVISIKPGLIARASTMKAGNRYI